MAGGPSVFLGNYFLNKSLKGVDFSAPTSFYMALFTTTSETNLRGNLVASASEVANTGGYTRKEVLLAQISTSTAGSSLITVDVTFDVATGSWGTIYQAALMDSASHGTGNVWYFGPLSASAAIQTGDVLKIPASTFIINL